ncbi:MAG: molybdopterin-dependent oxidoreductase [Candidatus Sulfotelmatobacter sp.]
MRTRLFLPVLLFTLMPRPALLQCQQVTVENETGKQVQLARADLEALPHIKVTVTTGSTGASAAFEGIALGTLLAKAGVGLGETLRGKRMASCLLVEAADGYRAVIALPALDPTFTDKQIVLAFLKDGKPLGDKEGPYRIVIPDEKRMARWVRQVTVLKIVDVQ